MDVSGAGLYGAVGAGRLGSGVELPLAWMLPDEDDREWPPAGGVAGRADMDWDGVDDDDDDGCWLKCKEWIDGPRDDECCPTRPHDDGGGGTIPFCTRQDTVWGWGNMHGGESLQRPSTIMHKLSRCARRATHPRHHQTQSPAQQAGRWRKARRRGQEQQRRR